MFHIILFEPEIPPNTGNIIRLSVNIGFELHLIKPLGFSLDEKSLKRAGMDYMKQTDFNVWNYADSNYQKGDAFIFGPESRGLPKEIREKYISIFMPMRKSGRSLNLANAVAVVAYEAWRQLEFK